MDNVITEKTCLRCGHKWFPRSPEEPKVCGKCKSPYWDRPKKTNGIPKTKPRNLDLI